MASRIALAARVAFAGLLAAIVWLALTPQPPLAADTGWDKLNHVAAFAALAMTGWLGFAGPGQSARTGALVAALAAVGLGIEALQSLLPPRQPEALDVAADVVGIVAGLVVVTASTAWLARCRAGQRSTNTAQSVSSKRGCSK